MRLEKFDRIIAIKDKLFRLAFNIMGTREDAEDVVQDVILRVWNKQDSWKDIDNLEGYCMRSVRNVALDKFSLKANRNEELFADASENGLSTSHPGEILEQNEQLDIIYRLIKQLPEKQQTVMQLRDIEEMSYKEIAEIMQISEEQVKVTLFRARQKVKEFFKKIDRYGLSAD